MKKAFLILTALLALACIAAMPFLCTQSDILPEVSTAYYDYKAKEEALTATGPEAELMRMLTGLSADTKLEPVSTPLRFSTFGLILAIGSLLAVGLLLLGGKRQPDMLPALCWTAALALPLGFLGARLVYCLVNIGFYLNAISSPAAMLKSWEGGMSLVGALLFIVLAGVMGAKLGKAPVSRVLHALCVPALVLCFVAAVACIHIGMGFGPEVSADLWLLTINADGLYQLDTAVLLCAAALVLCAVHYWVSRRHPAAVAFALTVFLYGSIMILLESLRRDGHMVWGFVHAEMLFDLFIALAALLYLAKEKKRILLALLATAILAGIVVGLEFALDRSNLGDGLLYAAYIAVLGGYIALGCRWTTKRPAEA